MFFTVTLEDAVPGILIFNFTPSKALKPLIRSRLVRLKDNEKTLLRRINEQREIKRNMTFKQYLGSLVPWSYLEP